MKKPANFLLIAAAILCFAFIKPAPESRQIHVVIDAGHGGNDFGAKSGDFLEKDITAQFSERLKELNTDKDVVLHFTRTGDDAVNLVERTAFINEIKPDLVLSLHVNYNQRPEPNGIEIYTPATGENIDHSAALAKVLAAALESKNNLKLRGIKTAPFHILKNANVPAMTLELGFLSNPDDLKYLTNESHQKQIANTILDFIANM